MAYTVTYKRRTKTGKMTTVRRRVKGNGPKPKPKPKPSRKKKGTSYKTGRVGTKSLIVPVNEIDGLTHLVRQIRSAQIADHKKRYGGHKGYTPAAMDNARRIGLRGQNVDNNPGFAVELVSSESQMWLPPARAIGMGWRNAKRAMKAFK